jgi:hypothetical protein
VIKEDYLNHALTPDELSAINKSICSVLDANSLDDQALRRLVSQRDEFIQSYLPKLSESDRNAFAKLELPINTKLHSDVKALLTTSLSELSGLVRGLKAVKKYK